MQMTLAQSSGTAYQNMLAQLNQVASRAAAPVPVVPVPVPVPVAVPVAVTYPTTMVQTAATAPVAVPATAVTVPQADVGATTLLGNVREAYQSLMGKLGDLVDKVLNQDEEAKKAEAEKKAAEEKAAAEKKAAEEKAAAEKAAAEKAEAEKKAASQATYTVQSGDSLWAIAERSLGDGNRWREIYDLNQGVIGGNPNLIHPGQTLKLPGGASAPAPAPKPAPAPAPKPASGPSYTVQSGDSLSGIAARALGDGNRWREIYDLNRDVIGGNPNVIHAGMTLKLPSGANVSAAPAAPSGGKWGRPVSGSVTSPYGMRKHPVTGEYKMHTGIDYGAATGTPVAAVQGGRVTYAGWNGGYGNYVVVDHGGGLQTAYAHLSKIDVRVGQNIGARHVVGKVGNTGMSTGPHLHFEVKKNGNFVNPADYTA